MKRPLLAFVFAAIAGCSLSLGLNGDANRPCQNGTCLEGYTCFKELCVPKSGGECKVKSDCPSGTCVDGGCQPPACADAKKDYRETDVDCGGGFCPRCADTRACAASTDCKSQVCGSRDGGTSDAGTDAGVALGVCLVPTCNDAVVNGNETDLDCGGDGGCPKCVDGLACLAGTDCVSSSCAGVCQPGACTDMSKNNGETDIDCGGPCKKCADGKGCAIGKDCASLVCTAAVNKCAIPSCNDMQKNATETDIDCGGTSACQKCPDGKICASGADCANGVCQNATCRPAHCGNGTEDVDESDKDCGGVCQKCDVGDDCNRDSDCGSNNCLFGNTYCGP